MFAKDEEMELWERYAAGRDPEARDRLIENYLDSARNVAARLFARRTDAGLEFADYLQYARVGLVEAVERFEPSREVSFTTFATYRMQGAILNGIEKYNERLAQWSFQKRTRRERMDSIIAERPNDADDGLFEKMTDMAIGLAVGHILEEPIDTREVGRDDEGPYASLALERLRSQLRLIVDALPERERQIISYHYFQHIPFNEIADMMNLSKGRISQLHARALILIREAYARIGTFDVAL